MEEVDLGPNGGLVYCMEYLVSHIEWLEEQLGTRSFIHVFLFIIILYYIIL